MVFKQRYSIGKTILVLCTDYHVNYYLLLYILLISASYSSCSLLKSYNHLANQTLPILSNQANNITSVPSLPFPLIPPSPSPLPAITVTTTTTSVPLTLKYDHQQFLARIGPELEDLTDSSSLQAEESQKSSTFVTVSPPPSLVVANQQKPSLRQTNDQVNGFKHGSGNSYYALANDGTNRYEFGFDTRKSPKASNEPTLMRQETRLNDGTVVGRYGYIDPFNIFRIVQYVAGANGYFATEEIDQGSSLDFIREQQNQNDGEFKFHLNEQLKKVLQRIQSSQTKIKAHQQIKRQSINDHVPTVGERSTRAINLNNNQQVSSDPLVSSDSIRSSPSWAPSITSSTSSKEDDEEKEMVGGSVHYALRINHSNQQQQQQQQRGDNLIDGPASALVLSHLKQTFRLKSNNNQSNVNRDLKRSESFINANANQQYNLNIVDHDNIESRRSKLPKPIWTPASNTDYLQQQQNWPESSAFTIDHSNKQQQQQQPQPHRPIVGGGSYVDKFNYPHEGFKQTNQYLNFYPSPIISKLLAKQPQPKQHLNDLFLSSASTSHHLSPSVSSAPTSMLTSSSAWSLLDDNYNQKLHTLVIDHNDRNGQRQSYLEQQINNDINREAAMLRDLAKLNSHKQQQSNSFQSKHLYPLAPLNQASSSIKLINGQQITSYSSPSLEHDAELLKSASSSSLADYKTSSGKPNQSINTNKPNNNRLNYLDHQAEFGARRVATNNNNENDKSRLGLQLPSIDSSSSIQNASNEDQLVDISKSYTTFSLGPFNPPLYHPDVHKLEPSISDQQMTPQFNSYSTHATHSVSAHPNKATSYINADELQLSATNEDYKRNNGIKQNHIDDSSRDHQQLRSNQSAEATTTITTRQQPKTFKDLNLNRFGLRTSATTNSPIVDDLNLDESEQITSTITATGGTNSRARQQPDRSKKLSSIFKARSSAAALDADQDTQSNSPKIRRPIPINAKKPKLQSTKIPSHLEQNDSNVNRSTSTILTEQAPLLAKSTTLSDTWKEVSNNTDSIQNEFNFLNLNKNTTSEDTKIVSPNNLLFKNNTNNSIIEPITTLPLIPTTKLPVNISYNAEKKSTNISGFNMTRSKNPNVNHEKLVVSSVNHDLVNERSSMSSIDNSLTVTTTVDPILSLLRTKEPTATSSNNYDKLTNMSSAANSNGFTNNLITGQLQNVASFMDSGDFLSKISLDMDTFDSVRHTNNQTADSMERTGLVTNSPISIVTTLVSSIANGSSNVDTNQMNDGSKQKFKQQIQIAETQSVKNRKVMINHSNRFGRVVIKRGDQVVAKFDTNQSTLFNNMKKQNDDKNGQQKDGMFDMNRDGLSNFKLHNLNQYNNDNNTENKSISMEVTKQWRRTVKRVPMIHHGSNKRISTPNYNQTATSLNQTQPLTNDDQQKMKNSISLLIKEPKQLQKIQLNLITPTLDSLSSPLSALTVTPASIATTTTVKNLEPKSINKADDNLPLGSYIISSPGSINNTSNNNSNSSISNDNDNNSDKHNLVNLRAQPADGSTATRSLRSPSYLDSFLQQHDDDDLLGLESTSSQSNSLISTTKEHQTQLSSPSQQTISVNDLNSMKRGKKKRKPKLLCIEVESDDISNGIISGN